MLKGKCVKLVLGCLYAVTKILRQVGETLFNHGTDASRAAFPPALAAYFLKTSFFSAVNASVDDTVSW